MPLPLHYLFVAGIGRRKIGSGAAMAAALVDALKQIASSVPDAQPIAMASCASGADQAFLEAAVSLGWPIRMVLPVAGYQFEQDFTSLLDGKPVTDEVGLATFRRLYGIAIDVEVIPPAPARREAFTFCSNMLIAEADVIVAIWDRQPGKQGGTNESILLAEHLGTPVVALDSNTGRPFPGAPFPDQASLAKRHVERHSENSILDYVDKAIRASLASRASSTGKDPFEEYSRASAQAQYGDFGGLLAEKADSLSKSYKRKNVAAISSHVAASFVGIVAFVYPGEGTAWPFCAMVTKIFAVTAALWFAHSAKKAGEQNQWVKARFVREINRSLGTTVEIARQTGESVDAFVPSSIWVLFRHLHRPLICFHCICKPANAPGGPLAPQEKLRELLKRLQHYREKRLKHVLDYRKKKLKNLSQQDYQRRTAATSKARHHSIERWLFRTAFLFYICGAIVLVYHIVPHKWLPPGTWLYTVLSELQQPAKGLSVFLPIVSAGLLVLPNLLDVHRRRRVGPALANRLEQLDTEARFVEQVIVDATEGRAQALKTGGLNIPVWAGSPPEQSAYVEAWARTRLVAIARQAEHAILTEVISFKTFVENVELG